MKIEFANRAVSDLREISDYSRQHFGDHVTAALEVRIRDVIAGIAQAPDSAPRVAQRTDIRVVPLVRYPFRIFYRAARDTVRILHIRHVARRSWGGSNPDG